MDEGEDEEEAHAVHKPERMYHPQSQVAVEVFNRTVQNYLYWTKHMKEDNFMLEDSILNFLLYYNNRVNTTTRYSPYDIMKKRSDENKLRK